ncbi:MAG: sulfotransferase family protein, partial [archaeon]
MKPKNIKPVFIGGCPRSGTTFLGSLLGKSEDAITVPESQFKTEEYVDIKNENDLKEAFYNIKNNYRFKIWNLNLKYSDIGNKNINSFSELIKFIIKKYASERNKDPVFWIDHTPNNFQKVSLLENNLPEAKYIHLIRDGRAIANSILPLDWGPNTVEVAAQHWVKNTSYGLAAESFLGREKILRVKYEDIVMNPEENLKRICKFIGINFNVNMSKGNGFDKPQYTKKQHKLVGEPPNKKRVYAWKNNLDDRQIELFEFYSKDFLYLLGYEKLYDFPNKHSIYERLSYKTKESIKKYFNKEKIVLEKTLNK